MKKAFSIMLIALGLVFAGAGIYTLQRGLEAKDQVRDELLAQNITTPADAAIPNSPVRNARTAEAMAEIVDVHAREATGGLTFGEMGRFLAEDGDPAGTSVESEAVVGADGEPVRNPLRNVAFEASAVRTGLYTSVMAFNVADLVVGLGVMLLAFAPVLGGLGLALGGVTVPALVRRRSPAPAEAEAVLVSVG